MLVNIKIVLVERKIARVKSKFSWIKIPIDTPNSILGKVTPVTLRATSAYKLGNSIIDTLTYLHNLADSTKKKKETIPEVF